MSSSPFIRRVEVTFVDQVWAGTRAEGEGERERGEAMNAVEWPPEFTCVFYLHAVISLELVARPTT